MGRYSDYKKLDEIASWDLDKGCRRFIDQSTESNRRLKKILKRQARARVKEKARNDISNCLNEERKNEL